MLYYRCVFSNKIVKSACKDCLHTNYEKQGGSGCFIGLSTKFVFAAEFRKIRVMFLTQWKWSEKTAFLVKVQFFECTDVTVVSLSKIDYLNHHY